MTQETKDAIIKGLKTNLVNAQDNLYRAKASFRNRTAEYMSAPYGQSDRTPNEILTEYENWEQEVKSALQETLELFGY
jgi:hypothetical protein